MKNVVVGFHLVLLMGLSACNLRGQKPDQEGQDSSSLASTSYGATLSKYSIERAHGMTWGRGNCYLAVWDVFRRALGTGIEKTSVPATSAYQFGDWADRNPNDLANVFKLKKSSGAPENAPLGSVLVYYPGQCGHHPIHGHIEIVVPSKRACSDYCAPIDRTCPYPRVYAPIGTTGATTVATNAGVSAPAKVTSNAGKSSSSVCGTKMINICIQYDGGTAACNRKYSCASSTLM